MTDQKHQITPPPELVQQWQKQLFSYLDPPAKVAVHELSRLAAQWGADTELEACCALLEAEEDDNALALFLQSARRPNPPSLKEQALEDLEILIADLANHGMGFKATNIRRALEALPDDL